MKKIIAMLSIPFYMNADFDLNELISIAVAEKNQELFSQLALLVPEPDRKKASFKSKIKTVGLTEARLDTNVTTKKQQLGLGGAAGAAPINCLTKQEVEKIVGAPLPDITSAREAKAALVDFFKPTKPGGLLLAEIGATPDEAQAVKTAIDKISTK